MDAHEEIEKLSALYLKELGRHNHVTPTLFLNQLHALHACAVQIFQKDDAYKRQLGSGLETLRSTQEKVHTLQRELTERQPKLVEVSASVDALMVQLEKDKKDAELTRQTVNKERQVSAQKFQECDAIKQEADRDMAQVQPLLDEAVRVLQLLEKGDFIEIASYAQPPIAIRQVLEAICILLRVKPSRVPDKNSPGNFVEDYWDQSKKLVTNYMQLKDSLEHYDKENMTPEMIQKLKFYIQQPYFNQADMQKKSQAASGLCAFVNAMYKFYFVNQNVIPKRKRQAEAQMELDIVDRQLKETEARFEAANQRIQDLEKQFNEAVQRKEQLAQEVDDCSKRLERA